MGWKYYIVKDAYQTGPLESDVVAINPVRPEIVVKVQDAINSVTERDPKATPRQTYKSIRPDAEGIYATADEDTQDVLDEKVAAFPSLFDGPYATRELALAAIKALKPLTTHIPRPEDESESS